MDKRLFLSIAIVFSFLIITNVYGWGQTGHRAVGKIAENHLTKKTKKKIKKLLKNQSLAASTIWMDNVRSDRSYDYASDWHWVTIPDGMSYEETKKNPKGDVIEAIERITKELKAGGLDQKVEIEKLKMLAHLIGDIHQPMHVGNGLDRGGNRVRLKWFYEDSNLHRVWDSNMINHLRYSYSELAEELSFTSKVELEELQSSGPRDWALESYKLRADVYTLPEDSVLRYQYKFKHWPTVELRIRQAGVRLAGVLNDIYG